MQFSVQGLDLTHRLRLGQVHEQTTHPTKSIQSTTQRLVIYLEVNEFDAFPILDIFRKGYLSRIIVSDSDWLKAGKRKRSRTTDDLPTLGWRNVLNLKALLGRFVVRHASNQNHRRIHSSDFGISRRAVCVGSRSLAVPNGPVISVLN